jgi:hypothetical protein
MARKQLDVRTKTMSPAALTCRTLGHAMTPVPVKPARRMELKQLGQYAIRVVCLRGCSRWREQVFDDDTEELIYTKGSYTDPDSYLVQQHGTGRLPRTQARAAFRRKVGEPEVDPDFVPMVPRESKVRRSAPAAAKAAAPAKVPAKVPAKAAPAQRPARSRRKADTAPPVAFSS